MPNTAQNLSTTLDQMKHDMQREMTDLATKEVTLRGLVVQKQNTLKEIQVKETEYKQKSIELQKMAEEIQQLKNHVPDLERKHRALADDVTKIRLEHDKKNIEVNRIQAEYLRALKQVGKL